MRATKNNLIIFLLANNGLTEDNDVICYTSIGSMYLGELAAKKNRKVKRLESRFYPNREKMLERMKEKNPELEEFCKLLDLELP